MAAAVPISVTLPFQNSEYGTTFRSSFERYFNSKAFSDLSLIVCGEVIPVHRALVCAWSPILKKRIDELTVSVALEIGEIERDKKDIFKMLILYIYTGSLTLLTSDLFPLFVMAHDYGVQPLVEQCGTQLGEQVNADNVFYWLDITNRYNCDSLKKICATYFAKNFSLLMQNEKIFMDLPMDLWAHMLRSDDLNVDSEEELFTWTMKYINKITDPTQKSNALHTLLPCIRFQLMNPQFLVERVETSKTIPQEILQNILYEAYRFYSLPKKLQKESEVNWRNSTGPRDCKFCGKTYKERDNTETSCHAHRMNCKCAQPFNYYPNPVNSPNCCCSGCRSVCTLCGQCKCYAPCKWSKHEPDRSKMSFWKNPIS